MAQLSLEAAMRLKLIRKNSDADICVSLLRSS